MWCLAPSHNGSRGGARSGRGCAAPRLGEWENTMTPEQKIIRAKVGLLELAKQIGNASQACKMMGYSCDSFYRFKELLSGRPACGAALCQRRAASQKIAALKCRARR